MKRSPQTGTRVHIPVCELEFVIGGDTLWIHNAQGMTVLRIKARQGIEPHMACENPCSHADILLKDQKLAICLSSDARFDKQGREEPVNG